MLQVLDEDRIGRSLDHRLLASGDLVERVRHVMKGPVQFGNLVVAGERRRQLPARRQADRVVPEPLQAPADAAAEREREDAREQNRRGGARHQQPVEPLPRCDQALSALDAQAHFLAGRTPPFPRGPVSSGRSPSPP